MVWMLLIGVGVWLVFGIPIGLLYRSWAGWVGRVSAHLRTFEKARRFGFRSWAARSFVLDAPVDRIKQQLDSLTEIALGEVERPSAGRGSLRLDLAALGRLAGRQTFPTGIEIEWVDPDTAELRARPYSDWPLSPDDQARLPFRQRQLMVEHALLYVEPAEGSRTRISYEIEVPAWAYIMSGLIVVLVGWVGWGVLHGLGSGLLGDFRIVRSHRVVMFVLSAALAWILTRIIPVLRLQSISLLDNVISTFAPLVPRGRRE